MKKIITIAATALLLAACTQQKQATDTTETTTTGTTPVPTVKVTASPTMESSTGASMVDSKKPSFKMMAQSNSKQDGTAMFEEVGGRVKVTVTLASATAAAEPAHIHMGSCPTPGDVKYPLTDVVNGKSETTLPAGVTLTSLGNLGKLAVNVHKSKADMKTYVSCADLKFTATAMTSPTGSAKASMLPSTTAKSTSTPRATAQ